MNIDDFYTTTDVHNLLMQDFSDRYPCSGTIQVMPSSHGQLAKNWQSLGFSVCFALPLLALQGMLSLGMFESQPVLQASTRREMEPHRDYRRLHWFKTLPGSLAEGKFQMAYRNKPNPGSQHT